MKKTNNTIVKCNGSNIPNFINNCIKEGVSINNLSRIDSRNIQFELSDKDLNKFKNVNQLNYRIEMEEGGKNKLKKLLLYRCGLIIGFILSIILIFFISNRLLNIQVSGLTKYSKEEVITEINNYGLKLFTKIDKENDELENHLLSKFDFSMVSIISKGNTLIVNIKEEIADISDEYTPITADYDMIITSINVYSGYSEIEEGDIIYKGDVLVYPYEIKNDNKISVIPVAEIRGDVYFSSRYNFKNSEIVTERTGNKSIITSSIFLGKNKLFDNIKNNPYERYEIEESDELISFYILPIRIKKVVAYEIVEKEITHNFEEEKEKIISNLKDNAYSLVPENFKVDSEDVEISSTNYGNIVTIYLKSSVYLKYNK